MVDGRSLRRTAQAEQAGEDRLALRTRVGVVRRPGKRLELARGISGEVAELIARLAEELGHHEHAGVLQIRLQVHRGHDAQRAGGDGGIAAAGRKERKIDVQRIGGARRREHGRVSAETLGGQRH